MGRRNSPNDIRNGEIKFYSIRVAGFKYIYTLSRQPKRLRTADLDNRDSTVLISKPTSPIPQEDNVLLFWLKNNQGTYIWKKIYEYGGTDYSLFTMKEREKGKRGMNEYKKAINVSERVKVSKRCMTNCRNELNHHLLNSQG